MKTVFGAMLALLLPLSASPEDYSKIPLTMFAMSGCWQGQGDVRGKPVTLTLTAYPTLERTMFAIDATSVAAADPKDRYAAHLLFGAVGEDGGIAGLWADSFGAAYTATGKGALQGDGFVITYAYPDADFVNRWRKRDHALEWQITAKDKAGKETVFAHYTLRETKCD
jgi:hypothetical protein